MIAPSRISSRLAAALIALTQSPLARADADLRPAVPLPAYTQECSSCHVAYPPALLPAASWRRLMAGLAQHFGSDASLDGATSAAIGTWLTANAAAGKLARQEPPQDRISRANWFMREHREIAAAVWQRPSIKSPSNCSACHPRAEKGDFDEHGIRIPR